MIYTTYPGEARIRPGYKDHDGEFISGEYRAEMPWLTYYQRMEKLGNRQEVLTAKRISNMRIWRIFHWEPGPAEKVLGYLATGRWDQGEQTKRSRKTLSKEEWAKGLTAEQIAEHMDRIYEDG